MFLQSISEKLIRSFNISLDKYLFPIILSTMILERRVQHRSLFGGKTINWQAFDEEEAKKRGIPYSYWKDLHYSKELAESVPFYVLSDDGIVVPIHSIAFIRSGIVLKSAFGYYHLPYSNAQYYNSRAKMLVLAENRSQTEDYISHKYTKGALLDGAVVRMAANGLDIGEIVNILCVSPKSQRAQKIKKFYKSEECTKMVREEVKKILESCGITEQTVIEMLLDAMKVAKEKRDAANMLRAAENFVDMYGMKDKDRQIDTRTFELESESEDLAKLEKVSNRIKLSQQKKEN